jgi:hypothetical protein
MKRRLFPIAGAFAALMVLAAVPVFAQEPMTISGAWLRENVKHTWVANESEKEYYYFSPGGVDGTAVAVAVAPDVLGGEQIIPFTGTWDFEEKDGKQLFCVYGVRLFVSGKWIGIKMAIPYQRVYRFYTENGTQKMEFGEGDLKEIWTKIGTKLTDLPEVGVLAYKDNTGGAFWSRQPGIVVK